MRARVAIAPYGSYLTLTDSRQTFLRLSGVSAEGAVGMVQSVSGGYVLGVFDGEVSTLVHELTHVILFEAQRVGIDPCASSGEPMAYLMDDLFTKATQALWRAGRR